MALYLVTGGAGFIGSNLVGKLLQGGDRVRAFDDFSTGKPENLAPYLQHPGFQLIVGDLRNPDEVKRAVSGVEFILHQGALPSVPRSVLDPVTTNQVNVLGTLHVLQAAREFKVRRVVYASSSSVYGNNEELPKHEGMPVMPLSPYAVSKYAAERYCQVFNNIYGLETVCLRYFNVFGPNQDPSSQYSAVIPKFLKLMKEGRSPVIFGDGLQSRDFSYVENVLEANLLACHVSGVGGQVFNIACGMRYTLLDLVEIINQVRGTRISAVHEAERPGDVKHSLASVEKARLMLGYRPVVHFREGLERLITVFD